MTPHQAAGPRRGPRTTILLGLLLLACSGGDGKAQASAAPADAGSTSTADTATVGPSGNSTGSDPFTAAGCTPPAPKLATVHGGTVARAVLARPDGSFVLAGEEIVHPNVGLTSVRLVGVASSGLKLWEELYDHARVQAALGKAPRAPNGSFHGATALFASGDGLLVVGWQRLAASSPTQGWVVRLDQDRLPVAEAVLPQEVARAVQDGDRLLLVGPGAQPATFRLTWLDADLAVDQTLDLAWPAQDGGPQALARLASGRLAVAGSPVRPGRNDQDLWIGIVDPGKPAGQQGSLVAERWYGTSCDDALQALAAHPAGGFVLAAHVPERVPGHAGAWLAKLDDDGQVLWGRTLLEPGAAADLEVLPDGRMLLAGSLPKTPASQGTDVWLALLDAGGGRLWSGRYPFASATWAEAVAVNPKGGYVLAGKGADGTAAGVMGLLFLQTAPTCEGKGLGADEFVCALFAPGAAVAHAEGAPNLKFQWQRCGLSQTAFEIDVSQGGPPAGDYCIGEHPSPRPLPAGVVALSPYLRLRPNQTFAQPGHLYLSAGALGVDVKKVTGVWLDRLDGAGFQALPGFKASPNSGVIEADAPSTGVFVLGRQE